MRRGNVEDKIHAAIVAYLRATLVDCAVHHSPNGGLRSKSAGAKFKWLGTIPGWPDIEIVAPHGRVYFLEVKAPKGIGFRGGILSEAQDAVRFHFVRHGIPFAVVHSIDEAQVAVGQWRLETRKVAA